ncbi:WD40 containing snare-dependent exocytosis protein [Crepidotus variabilis]|uniref:WD40 containing snare-dependent exocytosis protein n=1 Tax=Crepidotus variabilis TaxID=179855 RepID=A0A9P6JSG5_9AGAR|nr:WD40 containing snare-dependent exocytosis protein [Crepidotus variabilis]
MFSKHHGAVLADLSTDLAEEEDWKVGSLRTFNFPLNITALAVEPIAGILGIGTAIGDIYLFGGACVESKISLPEPVAVSFLQISSSTYFVLCLDDKNCLYVYNLLEFGRPKLVTSARFDPTNSITLSPSHTHAFLALQNGEIRTYDMTCLRKSPYTMPNMWKLYEEELNASGVPPLEQPTPQNTVDTVIHPRDLNLLFVAYAGGVVLTNLTDQSTVRVYDLILPPGAPGGAGYVMEDVLTPRRMMVTSISVHPSGHFFAVGYADGSFAFWAVEDDDKPLTVRTIGGADVHLVDSNELEIHLDQNGSPQKSIPAREPIFKLSWSGFTNSSDPRGGETILTVLGGLDIGKPPGVNIFALPPFNPQEPPTTPPSNKLHPVFRQAMVKAVTPNKTYFYQTRGIVQDYLVMPKNSPHFGGTFDPQAMLLIVDVEGTRTTTAFEMPPPGFVAVKIPEPAQPESKTGLDEPPNEPSSPTSMKSPLPPTPLPKSPRHLVQSQPPKELQMPFIIANGHAGVLGGCLFTLENDVYDNFVAENNTGSLALQLRGGKAFPDSSRSNELKMSKYLPRRILMAYNQDLSIRFFDLSTTLLIPTGNAPYQCAWPNPVPSMSIELELLYDDTIFQESLRNSLDSLSIASVQVAIDALEVAVVFDSGEVLIYHETPAHSEVSAPPRAHENTEFIFLDHIRLPDPASKIEPYFIFDAEKGPVEAYSLSDVGFLAISYRRGFMAIVDMRGPRVIFNHESDSKQRKHLSGIHVSTSPTRGEPDIVKSLKWTVCAIEKDPQLRVRLLALRQSGDGEIYTLVGSGTPAAWNVQKEAIPFRGFVEPLTDGTFVLDIRKGFSLKATPSRFAAALRNDKVSTEAPACILVSVGTKGARVAASVNGEKLAKTEWGSKAGNAITSQVVSHSGAQALVIQTEKSGVLIYSLPYLEHITNIKLLHPSPLSLSIDEGGDFIAWRPPGPNARGGHSPHVLVGGLTYGTFFDVRRAYPLPDIDFASTRMAVPSQPLPVSLGPATLLQAGINFGSWLGLGGNKTGAQIDDLLGGPDRPMPEKIAAEKARAAAEDEGESAGGQSSISGFAAGAAAMQTNVYSRLTGALNERGQMLNDLEERFQNLEQGSKDMVSQARRLAAQQSAKSWFGF